MRKGQFTKHSPAITPAKKLNFLLMIVVLILIIGSGAGFTWWAVRTEDARMREEMLIQVRIVAKSINGELVQRLTGSEADLSSVDYLQIKQQLSMVCAVQPQCRFLYLMGQRQDDTIFFFVDSEPPDSKDCSPPGQVYEEIPASYRQVFSTGRESVVGPISDRWGTWISALAPLTVSQNKKLIAVVSMDIDARSWNQRIFIYSLTPVATTLLFTVLIIFLYILQWRIEREKQRIADSNEALRQSEGRYKSIITVSNTGVWEYHRTTDYLWCSPEYFLMLGYNPADFEMTGKANLKEVWADLLHPEDRESAADFFAAYLKNGSRGIYENHFRMKHRNGHWIWVWSRGQTLRNQDGTLSDLTVGTHIDITERKQAEITIRESSDYLDKIFKTSADGIIIAAKYSIITMANAAMERILGYTQEEFIGKALTELAPPGEVYYKKGIEFITQLFEEGSVVCIEQQYLHKEGHIVEIELSAALIKDSEGNLTGSVAIFRDITERKQAEEEKKKIEAQLSRSEKMETVGLLAGGVAHDLNNMLGAIVGYPELLLDDLPLDSPLLPAIKAIKESGERAAAIVQDLLTLTRRGVAVHEIINLNAIVQKYFESREWEKLKEFHPAITVKQRLDPALLNLIGSPVHVSKVIANLVSNAAEAMPQGGTIEIATATRHLDAPLKGYDKITEGDYSVLSVSDNGIGIPEEDLQRIFEPFYTKKIMGRSGTGLGMSVVWGTVKDHGGHIDIKSRQGEGTTMTLYFPATRKEFTEQETAFSLERFIGSGETILVIDDIELQRDVARAILTKLRYRVEAVASGEDAVAYP